MRLGSFFDETFHTPEEWVAILQPQNYRHKWCPEKTSTTPKL